MSIAELISAVQDFGIPAALVFLGVAYWQKDKQFLAAMQEFQDKQNEKNEQLVDLIKDKTAADIKMESTLDGLKDVIMVLVNRSNNKQ